MLVSVTRAKDILKILGISLSAVGLLALPFPQANPEAVTQSLFVRLAEAGAFTRPGVVLICVGLGCLVLSAVLPEGPE